MSSQTDVAVIGAGPQGLAVAAHLRSAGVDTRVFGDPMAFWIEHMPAGMCLRSLPRASSISDPDASYTLGRFDEIHGRADVPIPLHHFVEYGRWFQQHIVPDVDDRRVTRVDATGAGFEVRLDDDDSFRSGRVVVATGIDRFAFIPPQFRGLPETLSSHTFAHTDFGRFAGQRVVVIGAGQSALESAALLHESDANVELIVRANRIRWLKELPDAENAGLASRIRDRVKPPTGVGPPGLNWIIAAPDLYRSLPEMLRNYTAWRAIPPAGADWLRPRLKAVPKTLGRRVSRVEARNGGVRLVLDDATERVVDHVVLGSGYAPDVSRYPFLPTQLVGGIDRVGGYPVLGSGFESSIPGLHFVGAIATRSYGPITRFVVASAFTGREVARHITSRPARVLDAAW
jgi:thioredoxin reductase